MTGEAWRPLLDGETRARAEAAVRRIAHALAPIAAGASPTLGHGTAGTAVLFAHLDQSFPGAGFDELEEAHLAHALRQLTTSALGPGLHDGVSGVAFALEYLRDLSGAGDHLAHVDAALRAAVDGPAPLVGLEAGLVGMGIYFLERLPRSEAAAGLGAAVARIVEAAVPSAEGVSWYTSPARVWPAFRSFYPQGYYELGTARGVAGVIGLLARSAPEVPRAAPILGRAVDWLLRKPLPSGGRSCFGLYVLPDGQPEPKPAKAAWCGGDPGIAGALSLAASLCERDDWQDEAMSIARQLAGRSVEDCAVLDASLCHGTAGIAHVLNRIYQRTGDEALAAGARAWFARTLDLGGQAAGAGGYAFFRGGWKPLSGLLAGAAGVALTLLAAIDEHPPAWDRILLLSGGGADGLSRSDAAPA